MGEHLGHKEHWLIDHRQVEVFVDKVLGEGGFGTVHRATYFGSPVAVKVAKRLPEANEQRRLPQLCNELQVLRRLRHPNLVQLYGATIETSEQRLRLVLELVEAG